MINYDIIRAQDDEVVRSLRAQYPPLVDFSTGRVERLLEALGKPHERLPPVLHVAGTNGKGSTIAFLRSIAEAAGLRVHALTSPHLVRFVERIRVAGSLIEQNLMVELAQRAEAANSGQPISFAEITTVIALLAFAEVEADLCLIEVGLGGRSDCTNVFDAPAVTVIAPIDYDHVDKLGPELSDIAWQKAGIIKRGRPCVVARQPREAATVIANEARSAFAPLIRMGREARSSERDGRLIIQIGDRTLDLPPPSLFGAHQFDNAALAATAMLQLNDPRIDDHAIARGISQAVWPARFQELRDGDLANSARAAGARLFLDGGHNPHGARALAKAVGRLVELDERPVVMIVGMYARKDAHGFFHPFRALMPTVFTIGFDAPDTVPSGDLAATAHQAGLSAEPKASVDIAIGDALNAFETPPHILICGGLHFAGEILARDPCLWPC